MKRQTLRITSHFIELHVGQKPCRLPIVIRKHRTSRRMTIRYQPLQHHLVLTLPRYATIKQGLHFIEQKRKWIEKQIDETVQHFPFEHGSQIPFLGKHYHLHHIGGRGVVSIEEERILVPGASEFMARRLKDWLRQQARDHISGLAEAKADSIGRKVRSVSVRDTTSRWGSCSESGKLSFSWRLVLAPYEVLDYIVSHEVAHLEEFNHSPAFWLLVEKLSPDYKLWRDWLTKHGHILYAYGSIDTNILAE